MLKKESLKVEQFNERTLRCLTALAHTACLSEAMVLQFMSRVQLIRLCKTDLLIRCAYYDSSKKKSSNAYRLSPRGQKLCIRQSGICRLYVHSSIEHDLALSKFFLSQSADCQRNWINESEILESDFVKNIKANKIANPNYLDSDYSAVDAIYCDSNGKWKALEITSKFYSNEAIEKKKNFARLLNLELHLLDVSEV